MFKITNLMIYLWAKGKVVYKYNPVNAKTDINPQSPFIVHYKYMF